MGRQNSRDDADDEQNGTELDLPHSDGDYTTADLDPRDYVPEGFSHDETLDFSGGTNYIFTEDDGEDLVRVTLKKHTLLFGFSYHVSSDEKGLSRSREVRDRENVETVVSEIQRDLLGV